MNRYALRNQEKIKNELGEDILKRIIKSLDVGFEKPLLIREYEGERYPILTVNDAGHSVNILDFYVIGKEYDVYKLAFKEFIG